MPTLITPSGEKLDDAAVEQRFAEAMAAPEEGEPQAKAPGRKDAEPAAPAAGEPQDGKARTTKTRRAPSTRRKTEPKASPAAAAVSSYQRPVAELLEALSVTGVLVPMPEGPLATRIALQMALVDGHREPLAAAVAAAADHNAVIRRGVEALTMGSAGWVLPAVVAVAPFAMASYGLWRSPVTDEMTTMAKTYVTDRRAAIHAMGAPTDESATP